MKKKNQVSGDEDIFCKPDINKLLYPKPFNYDKLNDNGFVVRNTKIDSKDIIIGKVMPIKLKAANIEIVVLLLDQMKVVM